MRNLRVVQLLSAVLCILTSLEAHAVRETYMVPMRDSVRLATDVYRNDDSLAYPVLLYRTPYWRLLDNDDPTTWNGKGYAFVVQDVRGRFGSEGVDSVFLDDGWGVRQDGYDTIDWIIQQFWCNGRVGMFGGSARGITTYRAAGSLHPNLLSCVPIVACSDFYHQVVYPGGEFRKSICENWLRAQGAEYMIPFFFSHPYYDTLWELMNLHTRTDSIAIPMVHIGGWYDCFSDGIVEAFRDLQTKTQAGPQKIVMGPWTHSSVGTGNTVGELQYADAGFDVRGLLENWLDYWVLDDSNHILEEPDVQYYVMGDPDRTDEIGCEWLESNTWPPESAVEAAYFLEDNGVLSTEIPSNDDSLTFSYDPHNPVPTLGGNNLTILRGPYDQRPIGPRGDVLEFSTEALVEPLRVEGFVRGEFFVSSDCRDTDFTLKLVDVYPDGREMLVTDGIARARYRLGDREEDTSLLTPGEITSITVRLPPTAIVFNSGHRIKVCVSSSNYPRYEVNPNTEDPPYQQIDTLIANNTVYFGYSNPSAVILPVVQDSVLAREFFKEVSHGAYLGSYPNPFASRTIIVYKLPQHGMVELTVHDALGRRVKKLVDGRQDGGSHTAIWNGLDEGGNLVGSGVYFCRLKSAIGPEQTNKLILIRE